MTALTKQTLEKQRRANEHKRVLLVDSAIKPPLFDFDEFWRYRDMLYFLTMRDIKLRYRQMVMGIVWAVIQPFLTMIVFTVFFGGFAKISSDGIPYPIFSFAALVPWTFFSNGISTASESLVGQAHLLRKVYFPRLYIPLARVMGGLLDLAVALGILLIMMVVYGFRPPLYMLIPLMLFTILLILLSFGISLWTSSLLVYFRDVRYLIPFVMQLWLFITPVIYPSSSIPDAWRVLYGLNPMSSIIDGFRWALLGQAAPSLAAFAISTVSTLAVLVGGLIFFGQTEGTMSDVA